MKKPQTPPPFVSLFTPERFAKIGVLLGKGAIDAGYYHWNKVRYLPTPDGFSHEDYWCLLKIIRSANRLKINELKDPITDVSFSYVTPTRLLQNLHSIDILSGIYIGSSEGEKLGPEKHEHRFSSSFLEESIDSSRLEGASTTRRVAREMIQSGRKPSNKSERMILNNFITMRHVVTLRDKPITPDLIYEIHRMITQGTMDDPTASGRLRFSDEQICVMDSQGKEVLYEPPPASYLPAAMEALCKFANQTTRQETSFCHPVIRAVILHFWLAWLHPFVDGNGRTARALFYWSMLRQGYWIFEYTAISRLLVKAPAQYAEAYLHTETDDNDLTYFLLQQTDVMIKAMQSLHEFIRSEQREMTEAITKLQRLASFNNRQRQAILSALKNPLKEITLAGYQQMYNISYGTAWADFAQLTRDKLFNLEKQGNKNIFVPASNLEQRLKNLTELLVTGNYQ